MQGVEGDVWVHQPQGCNVYAQAPSVFRERDRAPVRLQDQIGQSPPTTNHLDHCGAMLPLINSHVRERETLSNGYGGNSVYVYRTFSVYTTPFACLLLIVLTPLLRLYYLSTTLHTSDSVLRVDPHLH